MANKKATEGQNGFLVGVRNAPVSVLVKRVNGRDYTLLETETDRVISMKDKAIMKHFIPHEDFHEEVFNNGIIKHGIMMSAKQYYKITWLK